LSEQLILGLIAAFVTLIGTVLGAVIAIQNNKLTQQGHEQDRQKSTITRLSDEAKERQAARLAEREADRLDRESKEKEFTFWMDAHQKLSLRYTDDHAAYVALATKHDEFRRDYDTSKVQLLDVTKLSEQQKSEIIHLKEEQDKALNTISSMHESRLAADRSYVDEISRMNDDSARKQTDLQSQIDKLTDNLKKANEEIRQLHVDIQDFNSVNMQLARKLQDALNERDALQLQVAVLQGQLAALKAPQPDPLLPPILTINPDTGETEKRNAA